MATMAEWYEMLEFLKRQESEMIQLKEEIEKRIQKEPEGCIFVRNYKERHTVLLSR